MRKNLGARWLAASVLACLGACVGEAGDVDEHESPLTGAECTKVKMVAPGNGASASAGVPITLEALGTCPAGITPEYQFWVKPNGAQNWTRLPLYTTGTSSWAPPGPGSWAISAVVRGLGSGSSYDARSNAVVIAVAASGENHDPKAAADAATAAIGVAVTIPVLANDVDPDGDPLAIASVTQGARGATAIAGGAITYTPDASGPGTDTFEYTIGDGRGGVATASVTVTVIAAIPTCTSAKLLEPHTGATAAVGTPLTLSASAVCSGAPPEFQYWVKPAGAPNWTFLPGYYAGASTWTPPSPGLWAVSVAARAQGATVQYQVRSDGVIVSAVAANHAPVAAGDAIAVAHGTMSASIDVTANDSDADGDALTVVSIAQPTLGVASIAGNVVTYTSASMTPGKDTFTYVVADPAGATATATVDVTIAGNEAPSVADLALATAIGAPVTGTPVAADPDGDALVLAVGTPASGTATVSGGAITYTPVRGFAGTDSFAVTATDGFAISAPATITVTVSAPEACASSCAEPIVGGAIARWNGEGDAADATGNGHDGAVAGALFIPGAVNLTFLFDGAGAQVRVPPAPAFDFAAGDFTVAFWVNAQSLADGHSGMIGKDTGDSGWRFDVCESCGGLGFATRDAKTGVTTNARVPTASIKRDAWHAIAGVRDRGVLYLYVDGVLRASAAEASPTDVSTAAELSLGALSPAAPAYFEGQLDEVRVYDRALSDGELGALDECVPGVCLPDDHRPVAFDDTLSVTLDAPEARVDVLANDSDLDDGVASVAIVQSPLAGTAVVNADLSIGYTPTPGFTGADTLVYEVRDTDGDASTATVFVSVTSLPTECRAFGNVWTSDLAQYSIDTTPGVTLDFETRGDGLTPPKAGDEVPPDEYLAYGVHFEVSGPPGVKLVWAGNPITGFGLSASCGGAACDGVVELRATFPQHVAAIGVDYPSDVSVTVTDTLGADLSQSSSGAGSHRFLGYESATPLTTLRLDRQGVQDLSALMFARCKLPET
jgi:hypothetical protein